MITCFYCCYSTLIYNKIWTKVMSPNMYYYHVCVNFLGSYANFAVASQKIQHFVIIFSRITYSLNFCEFCACSLQCVWLYMWCVRFCVTSSDVWSRSLHLMCQKSLVNISQPTIVAASACTCIANYTAWLYIVLARHAVAASNHLKF